VIGDQFEGNAQCSFTSSLNLWVNEGSVKSLISLVSGDGISGTYALPVSSVTMLRTRLFGGSEDLTVSAAASFGGDDIGLRLSHNNALLSEVTAQINFASGTFNYPQSFQDPAVYFANLPGDNSILAGGSILLMTVDEEGILFTPSSVTVIPEPGTLGLLALGSLALLLIRRKK
jgi:hypothetical protein